MHSGKMGVYGVQQLGPTMRRAAVFLDRDGVLNRARVRGGRPFPPASLAELEILDEAVTACALLREAAFVLVCVTNQPDIIRGAVNPWDVHAINAQVRDVLRLEAVMTCPHDESDNCDCRKPNPGLLLRAADEFGLELGASFMVGDRWRDVEAGKRAGCQTVFIDYNYAEQQPFAPHYTTRSVLDAAHWILSQRH